ncbi:unnamed protein product [Hymenolepis diminuta]|uniref:Transposase n=1 Tax=Hymenolepis diminuta TaxID=6216 RepID=A0A0R3SX67_HYMDI|nr:unnamed protein product [Hymenolepis diminuta]
MWDQMQVDKAQLESTGQTITERLWQSIRDPKLTRTTIRRNLTRYTDRIPHTRSQTATGRRSGLLELPMDRKSAKYEPLMEAIKKWQQNLLIYSKNYERYQELKSEYDLNKFLPN